MACKCGTRYGLFIDGGEYKCPGCLMKERNELVSALRLLHGSRRLIGSPAWLEGERLGTEALILYDNLTP